MYLKTNHSFLCHKENDIYENYDIWESDLEKFEKLTKEVPKFKGEIKRCLKIKVEFKLLEDKRKIKMCWNLKAEIN